MSQDRTDDGGERAPVPEAPTEAMPEGFLAPGQVLGDRYQIRSQLGRGGMGEVWRAFDLKLRVEVALKALLPDLFKDERRLDLLRREVRAAREVVSPNVCRIFDLIEADGSELVSMEYVDGGTLLEVLQERGPLDLKEAQDIASQFLAGLEAIHKAGLVHRDVKPENIMLTRAGRVVLMDFGLARQEDSGAGTVSGTPAYMAPEQAAGLHVDARADVYSAGVVLAEMVSPEGIKNLQSRQSVWEGIRHEPARVPDSPWAPVLKKAVAKEPDQRYNSAHTLTRALEDVTLRVEGAEDLTPYPGLASFTEADAEYFFGREAEIEAVWRRLENAHLLAIVGPSGAGKSSFIAAGLVPNAPTSWAIVRCTPGNAAISSLARVMAREMAGDADAVEMAVDFDDPAIAVELFSRWRERHDQVLLVVDQFEELFTLNPPNQQQRFAELVGRLALEADVRVLLSMRDDFLMHCNKHEALKPIFSELTPLDPPVGPALRRALVQPATKCGYRFEDDELVDEMLAEVEGERGALPLLAFAMSSLWKKRDRESGQLTRQAYHDIGGVSGALARHAEATLGSIGVERQPIVREIFRNLVTAEGTRAVREWGDLLSVFDAGNVSRAGIKPATTKEMAAAEKRTVGAGFIPAREAAEEVLRELIDARLLTSYEIQEEGQEPTRRVEIIHESLLAKWPRLVRWQTQDEEGAQLRDELRHAARSWDEHGRQDDRLWTGTAFREFQLWSERYPGGLTDTEEAFGSAMSALAGRRRRRHRIVVAAGFAILLGGLAVVGSFWRQSVRETRRAEGQKLFALAQVALGNDPTAALAFATKSLELADDPDTRKIAVEALWKGPQKFVIDQQPSWKIPFTPDGQRLVKSVEATEGPHLEILDSDGAGLVLDRIHRSLRVSVSISPDGDTFASWDWNILPGPETVALWSMSESRPLAVHSYEGAVRVRSAWNGHRLLLQVVGEGPEVVDALGEDGSYHRLGVLAADYTPTAMDSQTGRWLGAILGDEVVVLEIGDTSLGDPRRLGRHPGATQVVFHPRGDFLVTMSPDGVIRLWDPAETSKPKVLQDRAGLQWVSLTGDGSLLTAASQTEAGKEVNSLWSLAGGTPRLLRRYVKNHPLNWDPVGRRFLTSAGEARDFGLLLLSAPPEAEPIPIVEHSWGRAFHPKGDWLSTTGYEGSLLWHVSRPFSVVIARLPHPVFNLEFEREGRYLAAAGGRNYWVRLWPLEGDVPAAAKTMLETREHAHIYGVAVSPDGEQLLVSTYVTGALLQPVSGGPPRVLKGNVDSPMGGAFSPSGRLAAVPTGGWSAAVPSAVHIWNAATGQPLETVLMSSNPRRSIHFLSESQFLAATETGFMKFSLEGGPSEMLLDGSYRRFAVSGDGRRALLLEGEEPVGGPERAVVFDLETRETTPLTSHGSGINSVAMDEAGLIAVTGNSDGEIRIGPITGEEPHLFLGHENFVRNLAVDPLGRWIASGGSDATVRLWPMPDLSKPPLHTLPREELIAKLKTLTNLRVVRDEDSPTGWKLEVGPFPGWETVPTW